MQEKDWVWEKTKLQLNQINSKEDVTAQVNVTRRHSRFFTLIRKLSWLAVVMTFSSLIISIVWKLELIDASKLYRSLAGPASQFSTTDTEELREDIILLTEQVQMLTTSISYMEINKPGEQVITMGDSEPGDTSVVMPAGRELITEVQTMLANKNYDPGPVDGIWGNKSAAAMSAYQSDNNIPSTGSIDKVTYTSLKWNEQIRWGPHNSLVENSIPSGPATPQ